MHILLIKIILTPLLIAALTLVGRRWGSAVSGAIAGLPLTSGPVSVFLAIEQGKDFAAQAAIGTLVGLIAVAAFCFAYSLGASRASWIASTFAGLAAFLIAAFVGALIPLRLFPAFVFVAIFLAIIFWVMPHTKRVAITEILSPTKWDLPLRMSIATALVFLLTAIAPRLGPHITGLISPLPIFGGVLAVFAHRHFGAGEAQGVLRGVVLASFAFAVFFLIVGATLTRYSYAVTYSVAAIAAFATNALLFAQLRRKL